MSAPPALFDARLVALRKQRVAKGWEHVAYLHNRACEDLADRLEAIPRRFERVLALGPAAALFQECALAREVVKDRLGEFTLDTRATIEPEDLQRYDSKFNLIAAPLVLHWTNDLPGALTCMLRLLEPDGLMLASMFGGDTLTELRLSLLEAESDLTGGAAARVSPFVQLYDLAALLQRAGFALPAADRDVIIETYLGPFQLLTDLRLFGEGSAFKERAPPLRRDVLMRAMEIYQSRFANADSKVRATFEFFTATGWSPHESQQKPLAPGSAKARLADALGTKEKSAGENANWERAPSGAPTKRT